MYETLFSYYNTDPDNIRNMADIGGGGLMDIGCYTISLARFIFNAEPQKVCGLMEYDTDVPIPLEDAVTNMKVIEALVESAKIGSWI